MKSRVLIAFTLLAALLLTGCGAKEAAPLAIPDGAKAGDLVGKKDCEFQAGGEKYAAECGTLVVPENWDKDGSRLIALPVVRIPSSGSNPAEPVFFLSGGPGGPNLVWAPPDWILTNHDVVMVGYRGVEGTVTLNCPEIIALINAHKGNDIMSEQAHKEYATATNQCAARLQNEGVDLSGYTIPGVIEDMEAARVTLGYERINLLSVSYGTRIAQNYAYMHPDSLNRLILLSVNTPGHFIWKPEDFDDIFKHMSNLCAEDPTCSSRTSDLAQIMYEVNHDMPTHWLFFNIDPDSVRFVTHFLFFDNPNMTPVIDAYLAASEGDPSGLALINLLIKIMPFNPVFGDQLAKGGSADLDRYQGLESVSLGNTVMGAPLSEMIWPMATGWPIELIPQELRELQETDVEMLLVNGTVDFSTPPSALDEARPYYHKAQIVLLPEYSHAGDLTDLQPAAFERMITSYYDTGVADDSLYVYQPLSFKPKMSYVLLAKILVAAMFILPALVIWGAVAVVRRIRKRRAINH
jgi:pimeloyl-ACP methyl ester carboxylesterase/predicted small lipoprotein YifL